MTTLTTRHRHGGPMSDTDTMHLPAVLELAELVRPTWPTIDERIRASGHPTNEGDDDGGSGGEDPANGGGNEDPDPTDTVDHKAEAEKWKALARKHEKTAKSNATAATKLQELEDAKKSDAQKAADKTAQAEQRATNAEGTALRLEVALDKAPDDMPVAKIRQLAKRLHGSTREDLEQDAEDLFADFAPPRGDDDKDEKGGGRRRPTERLRSGSAPDDTSDDDGETDPSKLAAKVPRQFT